MTTNRGLFMHVSPEIEKIVAYKPGKPIAETKREYGISEVYKLASNENPLGPSPKAIEALRHSLTELHRYPDGSCYELIKIISQKWNIDSKCLGVGNGSNEIIDILIRIYCEPGEGILTTEAAFLAYPLCAQAARVNRFLTPLKKGYKTDLDAMAETFLNSPEKKIRLIFVPNPNNPTGTYSSAQEVESFLKKIGKRDDVLIIFDEAYNEFARAEDYKTAQNYMAEYPNVVVIRTLSKVYGLAGLRVGVLLAQPPVVELFHKVRNPFNVNELAQIAAIAALGDDEFIKKSQQVNWQGLDYFYAELKKLGLPYIESQGNFVMFDTLRNAAEVNEKLLRRGVIMRPVGNYGFPTHLRLSVGLEKENQIAMQMLGEVLKEVPPIKS
jgi:histidinol-phosphate aminotransferase